MNAQPEFWRDYYSGTGQALETLKIFSYSDRIRYYWADNTIMAALTSLLNSLEKQPLPETLVSQAFMWLEFGEMPTDPATLIERYIQRCVARYFEAAGQPFLF